MVHSIELTFDPDTEAAIRTCWERLSHSGIATPPQGARPHVTLVVAAGSEPAVLTALAPLSTALPLPVTVGAVTLFGRDPVVLVRLIVPSAALLDLQAAAHRRASPHLIDGPLPNTAPGQWTPHVTLARRVPLTRLARALPAAGRPRTLRGEFTALRHWAGESRTETSIGATPAQ